MNSPRILVIDDNAITRKLVRATLQGEDCTVLEAENGGAALDIMANHDVDLVLQDLVLPDIDGLELVAALRSLPGGSHLPIIAFSGFVSRLEEARSLRAFTDYVTKPVEPSRLSAVIWQYLTPPRGGEQAGQHRRILVVGDDPLWRKLLTVHFQHAGFTVDAAADGAIGLHQARRLMPDAIVSDTLMPGMDGFRFCSQVRADPQLRHIPIVLTSSEFTDYRDEELARTAGATTFVPRTPDFRGLLDALISAMAEPAPARAAQPVELPMPEYAERIADQLARSAAAARRLAVLEGNLEILMALAQGMLRPDGAMPRLEEVAYRALEASGASRAAAYLLDPGGNLRLAASLGYEEGERRQLFDFFGHQDQLQAAMARGEPVEVQLTRPSQETAAVNLPAWMAANSILIAPLFDGEKPLGALAMAWEDSSDRQMWPMIGAAVSALLSQAVMLARAVASEHAARVAAVEALAARDEFISVAAHELRSPMTSLLGLLQFLTKRMDRQDVELADLRQHLGTVHQQSLKVARLVENLFDVSQIGASGLVLHRAETDVVALAQGVVRIAQGATNRHEIVLRASAVELLAEVDPLRLEQVLANLLDNAIKYSPGGRVEVDVSQPSPGTVEVAVRDHGTGIPPGERERIFDRYHQAHGDTRQSGMGLGLYVSRYIVEQHGGSLAAEFPPDGGSRFVIRLPAGGAVP